MPYWMVWAGMVCFPGSYSIPLHNVATPHSSPRRMPNELHHDHRPCRFFGECWDLTCLNLGWCIYTWNPNGAPYFDWIFGLVLGIHARQPLYNCTMSYIYRMLYLSNIHISELCVAKPQVTIKKSFNPLWWIKQFKKGGWFLASLSVISNKKNPVPLSPFEDVLWYAVIGDIGVPFGLS